MTHSASGLTYEQVKRELGDRQREVYQLLTSHPGMCFNEIKHALGYSDKCQVTGRVKELRVLGLLKRFGCYQRCGHSKMQTLHWYPETVFTVNPSALKNPAIKPVDIHAQGEFFNFVSTQHGEQICA